YEWITYLTTSARFRMTKRLALGLEAPLSARLSGFGLAEQQRYFAGSLRLTLSYLSDDDFGTRGRL
ncbi:MAG: hypothetical protein ACT4TC_14625, partial [Myxococcaceae bacterium]